MVKPSSMTVAFRADASFEIGTGHVMRCLTLAEALRARGDECHFICREHPGNLLELVRERGFDVSPIPLCSHEYLTQEREDVFQPPHALWLGCDWMTDARQTSDILSRLRPDWLVVDHYALDQRWEDALRGKFKKLLVIDDLADRSHICDLLLDQNLGRGACDYEPLVPEHCELLIGPSYALLRSEFAALRDYSLARRRSPSVKRLLITFGGVDQPNATCQVLEAIKGCRLPQDSSITVVMGGIAPWLSQVRETAAEMPWQTDVRVNTSEMAQLMADSDLAIGAAGSTSWERCCLGLPTLLVVLAANQGAGAKSLNDAGAASLIGDVGAIGDRLCSTIIAVLDQKTLSYISWCASRITDGSGVERVMDRMFASND